MPVCKEDIDRLCVDLERRIPDEEERYLSYFTIAHQYLDIDEWRLARHYLKKYLKVKTTSTATLKLLGEIFEKINRRESALSIYLYSIKLKEDQPDLIEKIQEFKRKMLLSETDLSRFEEEGRLNVMNIDDP